MKNRYELGGKFWDECPNENKKNFSPTLHKEFDYNSEKQNIQNELKKFHNRLNTLLNHIEEQLWQQHINSNPSPSD